MADENRTQRALKGKLEIVATLRLDTGLHIGASKEFAPIGAVDSPFIRDPLTKQPIIPGSSLKGKIRTLLARGKEPGEWLREIEEDPIEIKRLFGSANKKKDEGGISPRLQFFDIKMTEDSLRRFEEMEMDTYIGEVKFENTINRLTAAAMPRQIERVPAGAEFAFRLVYNIEASEEVVADITLLANGLKLLQMDYLGGSGSRGYGRVSFVKDTFDVKTFSLDEGAIADIQSRIGDFKKLLEGSRVS